MSPWGGDTEFLRWGGTAFHGGGQGLHGGGVWGHPGALWKTLPSMALFYRNIQKMAAAAVYHLIFNISNNAKSLPSG